MRQIFNSFCLASTVIVFINQSAKAEEGETNYLEGTASNPQVKLEGSKSWQKIKQIQASTIAQAQPPATVPGFPQNLRLPNPSPPATAPGFPQNLRSPQNPQVTPSATPPLSKLNPSPNPLQFPTKPEEVRLEAAEAISLQQALDLARRNNRQLQVAILTLERSRANVREAQAEEYPTLSIQGGLTSRGSNVFSDVSSSTGSSNQLSQLINQNNSVSNASSNVNSSTESGNTQINQSVDQSISNSGNNSDSNVNSSTGSSNTQINQSVNQSSNSNNIISSNSSGGSSTALTGTIQLSYNVYTAGARTARIRAAEEQLRFDQLDVERLTEQLRLDVSNDYYDLQAADEQVRINRAAVANAEASLRDAQAREQAGVGTRFDVLQSQVQLANANQDLTNSLSQQQVARRQLVNRLSLAQAANAIASDPVEIAGVWNLSLEESIIAAFQNRAELQQQLVQRNISEQNRRIALASIRPRVGVSSSYNLRDTFNDDASFGDDYSLGANVTWNLYDGGAARASARAQEANIAIAETNFADTRNQVRFEVEEAYSNLQSNLANIQTASVGLEQAREALRLARLRFQAGVGIQTEVIDAEDNLTQAEGNRVTAIINYNRALASLTRAISSSFSQ
ncbi:MAG: TolC family protein [Chroococcus sp. CMT-3BRIN-NPC107]|nr:TolC family protein [Chroococcus sp. CMT-3BRIN-NPC107]